MSRNCGRSIRDERGAALLVALMASMLLTALGMALILVTDTETMITANYRNNNEALYAADAAVERVVQDLLLVPDWNRIWSENLKSSFVDSSNCTGTVDTVAGRINLTAATTQLQNETNTENLWGPNNPVWRPYACGAIRDLLPDQALESTMYAVIWTADDPADGPTSAVIDGNPLRDTNGVITLHAEAFGAGGTRKVIEVTVSRTNTTEIERGQIAQRGQEELNQRARKAAVQSPGRSLTRMNMQVGEGRLR